MDEYICRDCGHPDNDLDPKTREVVKPIHVARLAPVDGSCRDPTCELHNEVSEVIPGVQMSRPRMVLGDWCLICARFCGGHYEYSWEGP